MTEVQAQPRVARSQARRALRNAWMLLQWVGVLVFFILWFSRPSRGAPWPDQAALHVLIGLLSAVLIAWWMGFLVYQPSEEDGRPRMEVLTRAFCWVVGLVTFVWFLPAFLVLVLQTSRLFARLFQFVAIHAIAGWFLVRAWRVRKTMTRPRPPLMLRITHALRGVAGVAALSSATRALSLSQWQEWTILAIVLSTGFAGGLLVKRRRVNREELATQ